MTTPEKEKFGETSPENNDERDMNAINKWRELAEKSNEKDNLESTARLDEERIKFWKKIAYEKDKPGE